MFLNSLDVLNTKARYNSVYDVVKFVLAIAIIAIHSNLLPNILYPWLRLAVPIFFMLSSFLFFSKINTIPEPKSQRSALLRFVLRNLKLYLFWFIVLFPFTALLRNYFLGLSFNITSVFVFLLRVLQDFLFGSTFRSSWFIMALIISVTLVFFLSKRVNTVVLTICTFVVFSFVVLRSSYLPFFENNSLIFNSLSFYEKLFAKPYWSFPAALIWVVLGKYFADNNLSLSRWKNVILFIVSSIFLYVEWCVLYITTESCDNDCYFFLIPTAISLFLLIKQIKPFQVVFSLFLRKSSTVIYALHGSLTIIFSLYFSRASTVFILSFIVSFAVSMVVCYLEKFKMFRWLKYSH